ncbi:hypothetical protein [Chryseobacterium sp. 22458]|uniref:hypothetical protein n=1 Tax=Chryseobacterium sp. 22458 TaxID=3453921 RepID=UPI003F82C4C7
MSRIRIVKGKYTKITGGDHYMFSDGNIISSAGGKYEEQGNEGGIVFDAPKPYEPWKNFKEFKTYYTYIGSTINKNFPLKEINMDRNVKTCLTCITMLMKVEAKDEEMKNQFYLHNWMYNFSIYMNNRGEVVYGTLDLFSYLCDNSVMVDEQDKFGMNTRNYKNITTTNFPLANKGKALHDEIFLDKKISLKNGTTYEMDYEGGMGNEDFYNKMAAYLVEASKVCRALDISYVFMLTKKPKAYIEKMKDYTNITISCPLLDKAIEKFSGVSLFKKVFGIFNYTLSLNEAANKYGKVETLRGPAQMGDTICITKMKDKDKTYSTVLLNEITHDTQKLAKFLQKQNDNPSKK